MAGRDQMGVMRFLSFISDEADARYAADVLIGDVALRLKGRPDVVFVFFTAHHLAKAQEIATRLQEQLEPQVLIGASAEGVIGFDREIEEGPGLAVLAGQMPDVDLHAFHISEMEWPRMLQDEEAMRERCGREEMKAVIAMGDPFTTPLRQMIEQFEHLWPRLPIVGGMASAARTPGGNALLLNDQIVTEGLVGLTISGPVEVETIVSQGCRPIGRPWIITRAKEHVIEQLGGKRAIEALRETVQSIPEAEQRLLQNGLFIGRVINEYQEGFGRGDFLVRNVRGVDQEQGSISVTDFVRPGQTVQFQVRDARTATEDLTEMLASQARQNAAGGLLFSCNGRGSRMFEEPCHDISRAREAMPQTPIAGLFAAGEIGPVGKRNFVHGHTASFALFRPQKKRTE